MGTPALRGRVLVACALVLIGAACGGGGGGDGGDPGTLAFSFVLMADPHVYGLGGDPAARLTACVDWVNANRNGRGIELVLIAGDLGRTSDAKTILDGLQIPYVPAIGDNVIQGGGEQGFETTLASQWTALAATLQNWSKAPLPVANPQRGGQSYFQNFSFDHKGVHFVGLDWCTRYRGGGLESEQADLHDFAGGTWPWFQNDIQNCPKPRAENIVMLTHHPMHNFLSGQGSFLGDEIGTIKAFTAGYADYVYANLAGHYHIAWHDEADAGGFEVFVTDATHDDDNVLRLVEVYDNGARFTYVHQLVTLP